VYSWGKNDFGQLGLGSDQIKATLKPTKLEEFSTVIKQNPKLEYVVQIAAGNSHAIILTSENRVFTWGRNLQNPSFKEFEHTPILLQLQTNNMFRPKEMKIIHYNPI
jgi:alpha-tubulin suppressor-like RCC1 family protein